MKLKCNIENMTDDEIDTLTKNIRNLNKKMKRGDFYVNDTEPKANLEVGKDER